MEKNTELPNFWEDHEKARDVSQRISVLKEELEKIESLKKDFNDLKELSELGQADEKLFQKLEEEIKEEEFKIFLSGKYDKNNAILEVFSGAGGVDAQDWATMIKRMYEKYCAKRGFKVQILSQSFGEGGGPDGRIGTKSVTIEIKGDYAYGFLKKETGVHRLVRISPFSAQKLRHTSFALVDVLPELQQSDIGIEIKPEDLKIDTFKSSGPGGQYVNKTESAVRITHIPTGIVVSSQSERLQGKNREKAMKILYAKLHKLQSENREKELKEIKGDEISVSWGNQIRSYVIHPYRLVKDLRTQFETSDIEGVLDGKLDEFIEAELRIIN